MENLFVKADAFCFKQYNAQKGNFACFTMPIGRESDIISSHK